MKFKEYPNTTSLTDSDAFVIDGDGGTKYILTKDAAVAFAGSISPEAHSRIFRGKNLGTSVTAAQKAAIQDGTFKDLFLGDYWVIGGVNWRIVDMDYWYKAIRILFVNAKHKFSAADRYLIYNNKTLIFSHSGAVPHFV